ncbi:hypothetical protein B0H15DRAFT_807113 [Mycena belliarum]|uniref:Uncharacterized protein n=1 Tax=Mycena belliarum TaxID=1033014 RepID=A0AAD6XI87_9AGAR|nr:hypothetical protein B0H15DRAFT_807113 [Mycena belliae]
MQVARGAGGAGGRRYGNLCAESLLAGSAAGAPHRSRGSGSSHLSRSIAAYSPPTSERTGRSGPSAISRRLRCEALKAVLSASDSVPDSSAAAHASRTRSRRRWGTPLRESLRRIAARGLSGGSPTSESWLGFLPPMPRPARIPGEPKFRAERAHELSPVRAGARRPHAYARERDTFARSREPLAARALRVELRPTRSR